MKAVLIIFSVYLTIAFGDVATNSYGTYLQTPEAITKMDRSDTGFSYSVTSARGHPNNFFYGVQRFGAPLALTYSSVGVNPISYITQNILPYDYSSKNIIPKIIIPYSTLTLSPLISQLSSIYHTSSIPSLLQDNKKPETAEKPANMGQPIMMDQRPMMDQQPTMDQRPMMVSQNPFLAPFLQMNDVVVQQNPGASNDIRAPVIEGNKVDDDSVSIESA